MSTSAKVTIPRALREQVWLLYSGRRYEYKCTVRWCQNIMTVFDFHVGHDIPESRGGATDISNLRPICARCNLSMGSHYSISEWDQLSQPIRRSWCFLCF
jgi:5-methylcytosine-specific restriction endonuclease McrA